MKRYTGLKRSGFKRKMSPRMGKKTAAYKILHATFFADPDNRWCPVAAQIFGRLCVPTVECHHKAGRGKFHNDVSTWLAVSTEGHRWIHDNPREATLHGWLIGPKASIIVDFIQEPAPPHVAE